MYFVLCKYIGISVKKTNTDQLTFHIIADTMSSDIPNLINKFMQYSTTCSVK